MSAKKTTAGPDKLFLSRLDEAQKKINEDQTITDETRTELTSQVSGARGTQQIQSGGGLFRKASTDRGAQNTALDSIFSTLEKAKQGKGLFGSRQQRRDQIVSRLDQPGLQAQTS